MTEYFCTQCGDSWNHEGMAWECPNCNSLAKYIITWDQFQKDIHNKRR